MIWLLLPAMALAFSSAPKRDCTDDVGCVLVKDIICGNIESVALGQDEAWANLQAKQFETMKEEKHVCPEGDRPDHRDFQASCVNQECVAVKSPRREERYTPPPPKSKAPKAKK